MSSVNTENSDLVTTKFNPKENCHNEKHLLDDGRKTTESLVFNKQNFKERGDAYTNICSVSIIGHDESNISQYENINNHIKHQNIVICNTFSTEDKKEDLKICGIAIDKHEILDATLDDDTNKDTLFQNIYKNNISSSDDAKEIVPNDTENWCILSPKCQKIDVLQHKKIDQDTDNQNNTICVISNAADEVVPKGLQINISKQNGIAWSISKYRDEKVDGPQDDKTNDDNPNKNNTSGVFSAEDSDGDGDEDQDSTNKDNSDQNNMPQQTVVNTMNDAVSTLRTDSENVTDGGNATDVTPATSKTAGRKRGPGASKQRPSKKAKPRGIVDFYNGKLSNVVYFLRAEDDYDYLSDDSIDLL